MANGNNNSQADNVASVRIEKGRWTITVRDNEGQAQDGAFTFLYVPPQATGVFAAAVSSTGAVSGMNTQLASAGLSAVPNASGIDITIGNVTAINPSNALLIVTSDTTIDGQNGVGSDNLVTWSGSGNSFRVFTQDLPEINGANEPVDLRILVVPFGVEAPPASVVTALRLPPSPASLINRPRTGPMATSPILPAAGLRTMLMATDCPTFWSTTWAPTRRVSRAVLPVPLPPARLPAPPSISTRP